MTTWQSKRRKSGQRGRRPQPSRQALQDKRDRADAARMAKPAPIYSDPQRPGIRTGEWIGGMVNGLEVRIDLGVAAHSPTGRRNRCDQRAAWRGDELLTTAAGLTWLLDQLRGMFPSAPSRRMLDTMQTANTALDEVDAEDETIGA